jgi:hypothetical protein
VSYSEMLNSLELLSRNGNEELKLKLQATIEECNSSIESFRGNKSEVLANEKEMKDKINLAKREYQIKVQELESELWSNIQSEVAKAEGVDQNPKLDKCWAKAWDSGHSAGYREVVSCFQDLCDLIK